MYVGGSTSAVAALLSNPISAPVKIGGGVAEGHLDLRIVELDAGNARLRHLASNAYSYVAGGIEDRIMKPL